MSTNSTLLAIDAGTSSHRASDWLWRPWYAKTWWTAIPLWWAGMAGATKIEPLDQFYSGALAGYLNVLFFPMTALLVLGFGYAQHWLDAFSTTSDRAMPSGNEFDAAKELEEEHERAFEALNATTDIYDPRSGTLYVGNSLSPNNGAHINAS
ncbi:hypothetical protein L6Q21_09930 [Sandaracinobacter sp. RS1-74]|uniref:hypothetical protein n=1 Tax=Sandaracinobacteroides sayramensis TaxID=2913411 RepID=UPI001EDC0862|nr:hypothetical protein [Sandaracinobacteroides sayramensis]MCG2841299.1 hypothetical protein [Sandaracinobacteroides sayramensis]